MSLLLDTHVVLWFLNGDPKLPMKWREAIEARNGDLVFSATSAAEISIKYSQGKLGLPDSPGVLIPRTIADFGWVVLPVSVRHGLGIAELPWHHKDPFDRLLVAQSNLESLPLVTTDHVFKKYSVQVVW